MVRCLKEPFEMENLKASWVGHVEVERPVRTTALPGDGVLGLR